MIRLCKQKKIDIILTKSISRFARNTVDCLKYIRILRELGISVVFEKENINTLESDSELLITLLGAFAQAESESISANVRWGKRQAIGCVINEHKAWGNKFIDNLASDIHLAFPNSKGYSVRNLKYMAKFALAYPNREFVQTVSAQIPWSHNTAILDKVKDQEQRIWYIKKAAENGWSHSVLIHQIESGLYQRQAIAEKVSNYSNRLPVPQSELAVQTMKDPYIFDFIPFREDMVERDIERALVQDVTKLLLELGTGFAFLGNQYHLNVGGDDFYIDLLFYNLNLRCYVVIELKTGEFKPEYAGQLNFYLSAVDGILKKEQDNPSIGLLLCKSKNNLVAEYSLKDMNKPIGISEYRVTSNLPAELENQLPSIEDIQKRINTNTTSNNS